MAAGSGWLSLQRITFSKEMGFTLEEFERTLPAALDNRSIERKSGGYLTHIDSGTMELLVSDQKHRKLASFSLPYLVVDFIFEGLNEDRVNEVMRFFNLRFQRGGG